MSLSKARMSSLSDKLERAAAIQTEEEKAAETEETKVVEKEKKVKK